MGNYIHPFSIQAEESSRAAGRNVRTKARLVMGDVPRPALCNQADAQRAEYDAFNKHAVTLQFIWFSRAYTSIVFLGFLCAFSPGKNGYMRFFL